MPETANDGHFMLLRYQARAARIPIAVRRGLGAYGRDLTLTRRRLLQEYVYNRVAGFKPEVSGELLKGEYVRYLGNIAECGNSSKHAAARHSMSGTAKRAPHHDKRAPWVEDAIAETQPRKLEVIQGMLDEVLQPDVF